MPCSNSINQSINLFDVMNVGETELQREPCGTPSPSPAARTQRHKHRQAVGACWASNAFALSVAPLQPCQVQHFSEGQTRFILPGDDKVWFLRLCFLHMLQLLSSLCRCCRYSDLSNAYCNVITSLESPGRGSTSSLFDSGCMLYILITCMISGDVFWA